MKRIGVAPTWIGGAFILGLLSSAYMYYLRSPSVVSARPELKEIDWWTAMFSGRFEAWLWHHHPEVGFGMTMFIVVGVCGIGGYLWIRWTA